MENMLKYNVAYVGATPAYYFVPFIKKLAKQPEINLVVHWLSDEAVRDYHEKDLKTTMKAVDGLLEGYNYIVESNLIGKTSYQNGFWGLNSVGPIKSILNKKYDIVIIHGWQYLTNILIIIACKISNTKLMLRGETPLNQELNKSKWKLRIRKIILKIMFGMVDRFLYIGAENHDFYRYYGVPDNKLFFAPYCVDNDLIRRVILEKSEKRSEIENKYGLLPNRVNYIFVGKLQYKKRPVTLINAFKAIEKKDAVNAQLIIVGSGDLEFEIQNLTKGVENIKTLGYKSQEDIFELLSISNVFILPSGDGETWGLVTNEAMNAGIPVILSDRIGSCRDLATDLNGYKFGLDDELQLTRFMQELLTDPEKRKSMGKYSLELLKIYSPETVVGGIVNAIKSCLIK